MCGVCVRCVCSLVDSQVEEMPTPEMYAKIAAAAAAATSASVASELLRVSPRNELVPVALYVCVCCRDVVLLPCCSSGGPTGA